jgi:signal transduction histidine kinase/ActR/RegA family two-component response regulator
MPRPASPPAGQQVRQTAPFRRADLPSWANPFIEALPDLIILADRHARVLDRLHAHKLPMLADQLPVQGTLTNVVSSDQSPLVVQACELAVSLGVNRTIEFLHAHHGDSRHYEARFLPLDEARCIVLMRDIESRKSSERAIVTASMAAQQASQSKSAFLANMSHEIRTPMNGILGMLQLLQPTLRTLEQREYATSIRTSADHLLTIINDILDLSKIEAGHVELQVTEFELRKELAAIATIYRSVATEKRLEFVFDLAPDVPEFALGPSDRLWQVLNNLLGNAIKFTHTGKVLLRATVDLFSDLNFQLQVEVQDTGIGIAADRIARIFEPFAQADSSTTRRFGGTGLGLTICRQLMEAMGGSINVKSKPDSGSTFSVSVPLGYSLQFTPPPTRPRLTPIRPRRASSSSRMQKRILVAEDNPINRTVVTRMLERLGASVVVAGNGNEVLEILRSDPDFDGIMMDVQMPELDGIQTTEAIMENPSLQHIPIVALTAHAMRGDAERCMKAGMQDYLSKPVRANELARVFELVFHRPPGLDPR